ncbi:MAG: diaminopimelate epimerase [Salibacteraceae bacterium]
MIQFSKYHGAGNDFIIVDDRAGEFDTGDQKFIERLCHRRFGIGADGLMLLRSLEDCDFEMIYFNSDGRTSSMCGNGGRCITSFAHRLNLADKEVEFKAIDGMHRARILTPESISLEMNDVHGIETIGEGVFLNTGSPHVVLKVEDLEKLDLITEAHKIRYSERFRDGGVNVNFIELIDNSIQIRTYERGVEAETLACGTGVTAAAIACSFWEMISSNEVEVKAVGGDLSVRFEKTKTSFTNIWKTGPVEHVFDGEYNE